MDWLVHVVVVIIISTFINKKALNRYPSIHENLCELPYDNALELRLPGGRPPNAFARVFACVFGENGIGSSSVLARNAGSTYSCGS